ncbi:hypothetical protein G7074_17875 [Pedobacter sp. HDW13]|uniref:hypothetical protein n=1 Tax=Pedobacter sp. HDW13 TaxID=2714940 RepID=UPI0014086559|nr:hypothetical protein [Pedobacter sp. HDW13]QIL40967.1 hypothetical protein G7074_17875 [Pedobacter sp. HDW13]
MVKFLKITAAIVLLLLVFYFGFFKYRQIQANRVLIPVTTQALFKINVDELYKTIAVSYVKHPSQYSGTDKKGIEEKIADLNTGLKIPANIYIYGLKGQAKNTFFSRLEIVDSLAFKRFILKKLSLIKKDTNFFQSTDSTFCLLLNKTSVAIAFSPKKVAVKTFLANILNQKNMVKIGDSKFNQLADLSDHMSYQDAENLSKLNFTDGKINFSNEFVNRWLEPAAQPKHRILNPESTISMWLNGTFKPALVKKNTAVSAAVFSKNNFFKFYKGYLDFEWTNTVKQMDTVVSYEYNDDFEQVEKKAARARNIPGISINMSANDQEVSNYLKSSGSLDQSTGKISTTVIPLYQVYFKGNNGNIQLSTLPNAKPDFKMESADDFFYFKVDFKKLFKQMSFLTVSDNLNIFSQLEMHAKSIGKDKIKLESELLFVNQDANSLIQLLKQLRNGLGNSLELNFKYNIDVPISK